jgi:hypothetical protein
MLVGANLGAPHPERAAQQHRVGLADLPDLDPGAPHPRPGPIAGAGLPIQDLGLVRIAIGILRE